TLDNGLKSIEDAKADEPEVQAMVLHSLGNVYLRLGDLQTAERVLRKSVELHRAVTERTGPWMLDSLEKLGLVLRESGRFDDALPFADEHYRIALEWYGPDDYRLIKALNGIGLLKDDLSDYAGAEVVYRKALTILTKLGVEDRSNDIVVTVNLASALLQ